MPGIDFSNIWTSDSNKEGKQDVNTTVSYDVFWSASVERKEQVKSKKIKLCDITPFEWNVRNVYSPDAMALLVESVRERNDIWNIDVFHILEWDIYIISDGHRTHRAMLEVYWPDHSVEVIVRKTVQKMTDEVYAELMDVWFITSNTKENLWTFELIESIKRRLEIEDKLFPESAPHKISQKKVFSKLKLSKEKAIKYNRIISMFNELPVDVVNTFERKDVKYNILSELSQIDSEKREEYVNLVLEDEITSAPQLRKRLNNEDAWFSWEIKTNIQEEKNERQESAQQESVSVLATLEKQSNKLIKLLSDIEKESLTEDEKIQLWEIVRWLKQALSDNKI